MVSIPYEYSYAVTKIAEVLAVRPEWLVWPGLLSLFIVPLVLNVFMFYFLLTRIFNIFPGWTNYVVAGIIAYLALPFNNITMYIAPLIIGMLGISSGVVLRIIVMAGLYGAVLWALPWVLKLRF
ncbi:MAG: hypothetical protein HY833_01090 [Candidatus Aenigmarchaeota archaeon]|nr:hypothetical protein [Candidatus Aenigmarchaeota archaeon]